VSDPDRKESKPSAPKPEFRNPGYPGALLILGIPVTLFGALALVSGNLLFGALAVSGGVGLIAESIRVRRAQRGDDDPS